MESQIQTTAQFIKELRQKHQILMNSDTLQYTQCLYQSVVAQQSEIDVFQFACAAFSQKQAKIVTELIKKAAQKIKNKQKIDQLNKKILNQSQKTQKETPMKRSHSQIIDKASQNEKASDIKLVKQPNEQNNDDAEKIDPTKPRKILKQDEQAVSKKQKTQKQGIKQKLEAMNKQKCKFFPFCKKQVCPYFHPTEKCTYFPHCKFTNNCLYLHEICKYGKNCKRFACSYQHEQKVKGVQFINSLFQECNKYLNKRNMKETSALIE